MIFLKVGEDYAFFFHLNIIFVTSLPNKLPYRLTEFDDHQSAVFTT